MLFARSAGLATWTAVLLLGCADIELPWTAPVSPERRTVFLVFDEEENAEVKIRLDEPVPSHDPIDVVLLFDATQSMGNVIEEARENAELLLREIRRLSTNAAFGVAALADYPIYGSEQAWKLYQDITAQPELVIRALREISLESGGDYPEAYARGLHETRFLAWRPEAQRFVVLFGDAPAHDPGFYGVDFKPDPGRDGVVGTPDDLRLADVLAGLAEDRIKVIGLHDTTPAKRHGEVTLKTFEAAAEATGGVAKPISSAESVVDLVRGGIRESYRPRPRLEAPAEYAAWLTLGETQNRGDHRRYQAGVEIHPPSATASGVYRVPLRAVMGERAGGGEIGTSDLVLRIGLLGLPWRYILLPLYLIAVAWLFSRSLRQKLLPGAVLLRSRASALRAARRLVAVSAVLAGAWAVWTYAPGQLPTVPAAKVVSAR